MHSATGVVPRIPKFDILRPLVLDAKGTLWLVDWANAGAFPPWMEYAHMAL